MDAPLQHLVALLQDEFERHETALAEIDLMERREALLSLYPSTTGDAAASGAQLRHDGSPGMLAASPAGPDVSGHDRMSTPARALNSTFSISPGSASNLGRASSAALAGSSSSPYSGIFLSAALELIGEQMKVRRTGTSGVALSKYDSQQIILTGRLKKSKGDPTKKDMNRMSIGSKTVKWLSKKVAISPGKFVYSSTKHNKLHSRQALTAFFTSSSHGDEEGEKSPEEKGNVIELTPESFHLRTYEDPSKNVPRGCCFIMNDSSSKDRERRVWQAETPAERQKWMTAIRTAVRLAISKESISLAAEQCKSVRDQVYGATDRPSYEKAIEELRGSLLVPVEYVRAEKKNESVIESDKSMEQMKKDLLRDTFSINGEHYSGASGLEVVIGTLATRILEQGRSIGLTEAQALTFARQVLYESNRTQFGGDAYEAVDLVCTNHDLIFITPHGQQSSPIELMVYSSPSFAGKNMFGPGYSTTVRSTTSSTRSTVSTRGKLFQNSKGIAERDYEELGEDAEDDEDADEEENSVGELLGDIDVATGLPVADENLLTVRVEAKMAFNINGMQIERDDEPEDMVWGKIDAMYERTFVFAGEHPMPIGAGTVTLNI